MRRPIFSFFLVAFLFFFYVAPNNAQAQDDQTKVRLGLKYSTHVEDPGISVGGDMPVADKIRAQADFTYYFVGDDGAANVSIWTLDFNALYALMENDNMTIHGLGGINYLSWSYSYDGNIFAKGISFDESSSDVGLNLGALAEFGTGNLGFWAVANVVGLGGDSNGIALGGGVSFGL